MDNAYRSMVKITCCKSCGKPFGQLIDKRAVLCDDCKIKNATVKAKAWGDKKGLKRMAVYEDDLNYLKSRGTAVYNTLHKMIEEYKNVIIVNVDDKLFPPNIK